MFAAIIVILCFFFILMSYLGFRLHRWSLLTFNLVGLLVAAIALYLEVIGLFLDYMALLIMVVLFGVLVSDFFISMSSGTIFRILGTHIMTRNLRPVRTSSDEFIKIITSAALLEKELHQAKISDAVLKKAEACWFEGNLAMKEHQWSKARQYYHESIKQYPTSAAFLSLSVVLLYLKRNTAAVQACDRALQLNTGLWEAHINRGVALWRLKDQDAAFSRSMPIG